MNVSFTLPAELIAELRDVSQKSEVPQAAIVRRGIRQQLAALKQEQAA